MLGQLVSNVLFYIFGVCVCVCVLIIKAFFPCFHVVKMAMIQGEKCTAFNVYCRVSVVLLGTL